jgi:hypothetical protein
MDGAGDGDGDGESDGDGDRDGNRDVLTGNENAGSGDGDGDGDGDKNGFVIWIGVWDWKTGAVARSRVGWVWVDWVGSGFGSVSDLTFTGEMGVRTRMEWKGGEGA